MGFLRKFMGGSADQTASKVPRRPLPETVDAAEFVWHTMQDLVDEINKSGPSGSLTGIPLARRIKLRDQITVIGERMGTNRANVKARPAEYSSVSVGGLCRNLANFAANDPYGALPLDPADTASVTIAQRCADYADEVQAQEREVERDRRLEHDRRKL